LQISGTPVADLAALAGLRDLRVLEAGSTLVTDITPLLGLPALRFVDLRGTKVGDVPLPTQWIMVGKRRRR
jgi:Leucine-rich repeat (LRR) protein